MSRRERLTPAAIATAAGALLDTDGPAALSLRRVAAALGVRPPSLYSHVDGLAALERLVALRGIEDLAEQCRAAMLGRAGEDGLRALAHAYRAYALAHPGVYPLTQVARPDDPEYRARADRLLEPLLVLLAGCGVPEPQRVHAARAVRSALHGFAMLETRAGFGMGTDRDRSFAWLVDGLVRIVAGGSATTPR